jgi:hypothetical protein
MHGWVRTLPLAEVLLDALPVQAPGDHRHPLRFLAELSPADLAAAVRGCAVGLERLLQVRLQQAYSCIDSYSYTRVAA